MTDSLKDSENRTLSESGMHEIQHLADPADQVRYKHVQLIALGSSIVHVLAVFLAIFAFREGNLQELSLIHLMHFVHRHTALWQAACFAAGISSLSFMMLFVALKQVLRLRHNIWINAAAFLVVIAISLDLQNYGNLMIGFSDTSIQLMRATGYKQMLMLEAWRSVNQALTQSVIIASSLYAISGLVLSTAIISGVGLPKWLGWTSIPVWLAGLAASVLTFYGQLSWAMVLMFAMSITFILWTIAIAVGIDPYTHSHRIPVEDHPAN